MSDKDSKDKNILERLIGGIKFATDTNNQDKLMERVDEFKESEKNITMQGDKKGETAKNPTSLDIGTSRLVSMKKGKDGDVITETQLNAFITLPFNAFVKDMLEKNKMHFYLANNKFSVLGNDSQEFSNIFNSEIRRCMEKGLLKADEPEAITIIKEIIKLVLPPQTEFGSSLCFSVPAPQIGFESDLVFHETVLKKFLMGLGYNTKSITEGMAVVLSELNGDNFTGIGISIGGGMCNVCLSFLSVPIIVFSIPRGGDDIDSNVARVVNETKNRVRIVKEESLDLAKTPSNKLESAFDIYYDDLIMNLLNHLSAVLSRAQNMPKLKHSIPIVLSGGSCLPNGFKVKFDKILKQIKLPIEVSEVKMAADPLRATARGALINASV